MITITASLMCASQLHLYRDIHSLLKAGIDMFHFDIMDGEFVENIALNFDLIKELRHLTHKKFDAHLMVNKPSKYIKRLKDSGVNIVSFHIEAKEDPNYVIDFIKREGMEVGIAISPETPLEKLFPYLGKIEYVMFMTVLPGYAGQNFEEAVLDKIALFKAKTKDQYPKIKLIADGAINPKTLEILSRMGVEIFVGGTSGLFNKDGFNNNLEILKQKEHFNKNANNEEEKIKKPLIINHRINAIEELDKTPPSCGVEIDIRAYKDQLILHHDPFVQGCDLEDFLKHYHHSFIIFNIKCEGIEQRVIELAEKYNIKEYFLLDVTPPFIYKLLKQGVTKMAVRYSEVESRETCFNFRGKIDWVFIDNLTHLPIENNAFKKLREYFKICIVSPELLGRDEIEKTKELLKDNPVDAILTDEINRWSL